MAWQTDRVSDRSRPNSDVRIDPTLGTVVHVVGHRQSRPDLATNTDPRRCPFCPGGLEAPLDYDVRWFVNRWPAMEPDRCEVILYSPIHDASLATLPVDHVRRLVDLWADRTTTLGSRDDVAYVLVFENRGAAVGATISHPHGQIYAYDHVPERPRRLLTGTSSIDDDRIVAGDEHWTSFVPWAPVHPTAVTLAPRERRGLISELNDAERTSLAGLIVDTCRRLDALYDTDLPYMMWINQRPFDGSIPDATMSIEFVSPWRSRDLPRFVAAAEIGAGEYFNPVVPEELATRLRRL